MIELAKWLSDYYLCSLSKIFNYILPKSKNLWLKQWKKQKPFLLQNVEKESEKSLKKIILEHDENNAIFEGLFKLISCDIHRVFFLEQCSYSEKIKFYISCIKFVRYFRKQVLILTPSETDLTELAKPLRAEFKDKMLIYDEKADTKLNFFQWMEIKNNKYEIVIGKRSAIFLPMDNLGLIIVHNEHDLLFKEERTPRYHTRNVAIKRAKIEKIPIVLHSNSPSFETYRKIINKTYSIIKSDQDRKANIQTKNRIVDMTQEKSRKKIISYQLQQSIINNLKNHKKIILFLNKRGFSSFILCNSCGYIPRCPHCQNGLSYHYSREQNACLVCHYCGKRMKVLKFCSKCGSKNIKPIGIGTQQLENEIKKMFPKSKIKRLDGDIIKKKENYFEIINDFNIGKIDILIGTQIALRRIDHEQANLLGIVSADTLLNIPDFRSGEKTFQMIKSLIDSFRKNNPMREIIIQTFNPGHHCFFALTKGDDQLFYRNELNLRKELEYPPFTHLIKLEIKGENKQNVLRDAEYLAEYLGKLGKDNDISKYEILGAKNMVIWKAKNYFRIQIMVKIKNIIQFNRLFRKNIDEYLMKKIDKTNRLSIDVDPVKMT